MFTVKPGKPYRRKVRVVSCGNFAKGVSEDVLYASGAAAEVLRILPDPCRWEEEAVLVHRHQMRLLVGSDSGYGSEDLCVCDRRQSSRPLESVLLMSTGKSARLYTDSRSRLSGGLNTGTTSLGQAVFQTSQGLARLSKTKCDENLWEISLEGGVNIGHVLVYVDDLLILSTQGTAEAFHAWVRSKWGMLRFGTGNRK